MKKILASILLGGLVGVGLGLVVPTVSPPAERETALPDSEALRNRPAPDFTLPGMTQDIRLADYQGKVVLLNFFETGCPHCHHEIPELVKLHQAMRDQGVEVIGVALDPIGAKELSGLAKELAVTYPLAFGDEGIAKQYGGIPGVPTSFVIDRNGRIAEVFPGMVGYPELEKAIRKHL